MTAALGRLTPPRPDVPLVVSAAAGTVAGGTARSIRVTAELDAAVAATPEWADGGEAQAFVRNAKGETVTSGKAALAKGARTVEIEVPVVEGMAGDVKVQVRLSGNGALARYTDTTSVALDAMPAGWGAPRLSRRGPSTGVAWVPTADPRFRRQERLRVSVGVGAEAGTVTGTLLDRQGRPINVPVKVDQTAPEALVAELTLAPLAAGDYVLALGGGPDAPAGAAAHRAVGGRRPSMSTSRAGPFAGRCRRASASSWAQGQTGGCAASRPRRRRPSRPSGRTPTTS